MKFVKCSPLCYLNVVSKIYGSFINLSIALTILSAISIATASQITFPQIKLLTIYYYYNDSKKDICHCHEQNKYYVKISIITTMILQK